MARSYLGWGEALGDGRLGAIAVLTRGADPALGHVGFLVGETADTLFLLGGNQGDAVSVAPFARSRLVGLRWPAAQAAQPAAAGGAEPAFSRALAHVLEMEGGYSEDPYDPGGPTNFGITLAEYASWRGTRLDAGSQEALKQELKRIAPETVREIYLQRYWIAAQCRELPAGLALMHFDASVNQGVGTAARMLQEAVGAGIDGEIGPETRAAVMGHPVAQTLSRYAEIRRRRYRALAQFPRFGRGWLGRVDRTLARAQDISGQNPSSSPVASEGEIEMSNDQAASPAKWWGGSMTVWGAIVTALSTVLPAVGPAIGIDITGELVREVGSQLVAAVQAAGGLLGTIMTIYGRVRATQPLERRFVSLKL
ncbi:MAG TPA: glycosyl hydrolase 108 family protein [Hyphomicrobiaceae bacterium]|nr:glycosyl hydrolase 108 family protein [Hyphomicrobiaceae bacterium]